MIAKYPSSVEGNSSVCSLQPELELHKVETRDLLGNALTDLLERQCTSGFLQPWFQHSCGVVIVAMHSGSLISSLPTLCALNSKTGIWFG